MFEHPARRHEDKAIGPRADSGWQALDGPLYAGWRHVRLIHQEICELRGPDLSKCRVSCRSRSVSLGDCALSGHLARDSQMCQETSPPATCDAIIQNRVYRQEQFDRARIM